MAEHHNPETILQDALELSDLQERGAYLDEACGDDEALREEVESLLAAHFAANSGFMDTLADPVWQEAPTEKEGDSIGRYRLMQQIGEGGFGTVYMAEQTEPVKRRVALKVIKAGMDTKEVIARFEAERQALALMDHPNIAQVHDAGATGGGRPYFVMELVKGVPLTKYCADKSLDTKARLELFTDVCAAVQHAHQKGIVHRDLKPSNILVSPHDGKPVVKVIDFGIAKAISMELTEKTVFTQLGRMIGTPQYMSPEQAELNALDVDTRSDIYSLGVVLYELLTGTTPLDGTKLRSAAYGEMQRMIREETPVKPSTRVSTSSHTDHTNHTPDARSLRGDLDWIVLKALEKDRTRRYETANALALDVGRHLRDEPVSAGPPSASYRMKKFVRRNRRGLLSGAAAAVALLVGLAVAGGVWLNATLEKRERVTKLEGHATFLIEQSEKLMEQNAAANYDDASHFLQARNFAQQLDGLVGIEEASAELHAKEERLQATVDSEENARKLIHDIEEALMKKWSGLGKKESKEGAKAQAIAEGFEDFGMNPLELPVEDTAARIRTRRAALQDRILVGLVAWADSLQESEPEKAARLNEVVDRCDSDPWRRSLRQAVAEGDIATLENLADSPQMAEQPTMIVLRLSSALADEQLAGAMEKLLRRAQREAPESFWTNFQLGSALAGAIDREMGGDVRMTGIHTEKLYADPRSPRVVGQVRPEFDEAIGFLRAAMAARPDASHGWVILGTLLTGAGHGDDAIACYQKAMRSDPDAALPYFLMGNSHVLHQSPEKALPFLRRAAHLDPAELGTHYLLGTTLALLGEDEEALALLLGLVDRASGEQTGKSRVWATIGGEESAIDEATIYAILSDAQLGRGDLDKALATAHRAIDADPGNANAHVSLGTALLERGELAAGMVSYRDAIRLAPKLVVAHLRLGLALISQGEFAAANASFREAIKIDPEDVGGHLNLGIGHMQMGELDEAIRLFRKVTEMSPGYAMAWNNLGTAYDKQGNPEEALANYKEAISCDPEFAMAWYNLATVLNKQDKPEDAVDCFRKAVSSDPDYAKAWFDLGCVLDKLGKQEDAIASFRKAVSADPELAGAWNNLAVVFDKMDKPDEAITYYRKAILADPDHALAPGNLAKLLWKMGKYDAPEHPRTILALQTLAGSLFLQGRLDEAFKLREGVLEIHRKAPGPEDPVTLKVMTGLAVSYWDAGRQDDAIALQERALEIMCRPVRGEEDETTLGSMTNLAIYYGKAGRLDDAIAMEEKALKIKRRVLPKDHPYLGNAMGMLAGLLIQKGETEKGFALYDELLALRRREFGPAHPDTLFAMGKLLEARRDAGQTLECARVIAEHLEHLRRAGHGPDSDPQVTSRQQLAELADQQTAGQVEPEALARYYEENRETFRETSVHLHMITIVREEGVEARAAQRKEVEALREKIANGTPFAEVARKHSDDKDPFKEDGGDRKTVKRGHTMFDEHLEKAIFALKPGTPAIHENEKLLLILKVEDRVAGEVAPLEEVREEIVEILQQEKRDELLEQWQKEARVKVDAWEKENGAIESRDGPTGEETPEKR